MIRNKITVLLSLTFILLGTTQWASAQDRPGSTAADFLKLGVSARAAGMGNAFIAAVNGGASTYYNPAAMAWMDNSTDIFLNHTEWFAGINHEFLSVTNKNKFGTFGGSIIALYTDEMKVRTPQQPEGTGATFYSADVRGALSYSRQLTDFVSFGATASFMNLRLHQDFQTQAVGFDIATEYRTQQRGFRFAMMIKNLGSEVKYINEPYPLPVEFMFGASVNAIESENHVVLVSASASKPNDGDPVGQVGVEYSFMNSFYLRGGYKINYDSADYSAGMGVNVNLEDNVFKFDYGLSNFGLLGIAHRFSIQLML